MKKTILMGSSLALATLLFTGCGSSFNSMLGIPNTKQEMVQKSDDKEMADAFSIFIEQRNNQSLDRKVDVLTSKKGLIELSAYNFIRFKDKVTSKTFNENFLSFIQNSQVVKLYVDTASKRGNSVKAYKGDINLMTFGNDVNIMKRGDNVQYIYSMSPTFIEFDKNNKIVSILTHTHDKYNELNNPNGNISLDTMFYVFTGTKAQAKQAFLTAKTLEDSFLYNAN